MSAELQSYQIDRRDLRWTTVVSLIVHALILLWLVQSRVQEAGGAGLAEITLLDPGEFGGGSLAAAAPAAPAAPGPETRTGAPVEQPAETRFRRDRTDDARTEPEPQSDAVFEDRLNARLATLQNAARTPLPGLAAEVVSVPRLAVPAGVPGATGGGGPATLRRGGTGTGGGGGTGSGTGDALALTRGPGGAGTGRDLALAALPAEKSRSERPRQAEASGARRQIAGASLAGPIADREVLESVLPEYPEWAKGEGVEASVTLYFVVLPDGRVKDNVLVQKTAGFGDFDDSALRALRAWRFEPLAAGHTGEQWGTITYHFRLRDAR